MKHVKVCGLEMPICLDIHNTCDLFERWYDDLSHLITKPSLTCYDDPFLRNPSCDKHVLPFVDSCMNMEMFLLDAKIPKLSIFGDYELLEHVVGDSRTNACDIVEDCRAWCLLCFYCTMVRPFNGIGMFYGRFVKDFPTHMSFEDCVVINGIRKYCSHILELLEQLHWTSFGRKRLIFDVAFHKFHMHAIVFILHVVHEGLWIYCPYIFDHFLKLLGQWSVIHYDKLDLLSDLSSCKLDVNCHEPTLYVEQEFVNLWKSIPYLSKNDVLMGDGDFSLYDLENKTFVLRPLLITFHFAYYEDPFLCTYSSNENAKSFVTMLKNMGIGSVRKFETKRDELCDVCVLLHNICFHCMTIKPFNGVGILYGLFVKNFTSNGVVWDDIEGKCVDLNASTSSVLELFEHWYEGYLDELVIGRMRNTWFCEPMPKRDVMVDLVTLCLLLISLCSSIKPFNGIGLFYGSLVKNFSSYEFALGIKGYKIWCHHFSFALNLSLIKHEHGNWAIDYVHEYTPFLEVASPFGGYRGLNPFYRTMMLDWFVFTLVGTHERDLRTNPFQGGKDDMTTGARRQGSLLRREPWIDWGPRMKEKTRR